MGNLPERQRSRRESHSFMSVILAKAHTYSLGDSCAGSIASNCIAAQCGRRRGICERSPLCLLQCEYNPYVYGALRGAAASVKA